MSDIRRSLLVFSRQVIPLLAAVLLITLANTKLPGQIVETGIVTGVVRDNSGALIQNARVTIRNTATGLANDTTTDAQGLYVSAPLEPGDYTVEIEVAGFRKVAENVRLEVGARAAANAALVVGSETETVEVQATAQLLDTESSSVSNLRTEEAVRDLPLNGRNFAELVGLGAARYRHKRKSQQYPTSSNADRHPLPLTVFAIRRTACCWMELATTKITMAWASSSSPQSMRSGIFRGNNGCRCALWPRKWRHDQPGL